MIPLLTIENPTSCTIIGRENRFTVTIEIKGIRYKAWINNTGRLKEYLREGVKGFCIPNRGKNDYRLFALSPYDGLASIIDTLLQMKSFEKCIEYKLLPEFIDCIVYKRNALLYNSRIDYLLSCKNKSIYLEVKSAALKEGDYAMYPDCPSLRGQRHIMDLIRNTEENGESAIMFIAAIPNIKYFKPYIEGDPLIYSLLSKAYYKGVNLYAIQIAYDIDMEKIVLIDGKIPVVVDGE